MASLEINKTFNEPFDLRKFGEIVLKDTHPSINGTPHWDLILKLSFRAMFSENCVVVKTTNKAKCVFLINLVWVWGDKTKIDKRIIVI